LNKFPSFSKRNPALNNEAPMARDVWVNRPIGRTLYEKPMCGGTNCMLGSWRRQGRINQTLSTVSLKSKISLCLHSRNGYTHRRNYCSDTEYPIRWFMGLSAGFGLYCGKTVHDLVPEENFKVLVRPQLHQS